MTQTQPEVPVFFLDIETVPQYRNITEAPEWMQKKFREKHKEEIHVNGGDIETWSKRAALSAEFGKIVCISVGKITRTPDGTRLYIKSFAGRNENQVLLKFKESIVKAQWLCAHNGMEFDFPFLMRRMLINRIQVPIVLKPIGEFGMIPPYKMQLEDTVVMWSGVQWKHRVALSVLTELFGLPSPKQDMDGSQVCDVYYGMFDDQEKSELPFDKEEAVLNRISTYCNGDIVALANIYCLLKQIDVFIKPEDVVYA